MRKEEIELTGFCGLYCGDCIRYKSKAADLARELSGELEKAHFDKYAKVKSASVKELESYNNLVLILRDERR